MSCSEVLHLFTISGTEFNADLTPKKATVKLMIQEELTKLADAEDGDQEDEGKDEEAPPSDVGVKA